MPTYAYRCDACGHRFETFQKFADEPLRECPACGDAVRRVIHPVGVVFKGSGWYITDSRPKPADEAGASDKSDKTEKMDKTDKTDKAEKQDGVAAKKDKVAEVASGKTAKASDTAAAD